MVSALSYFVMLLGIVTSALSLLGPWIRRRQLYYQFHQLGMDGSIERVVRAEDHAAFPYEVSGFLVGIAIIVIAIGLVRRREWARRMWMWGSGLLVLEFVVLALFSRDAELPVILVVTFRLSIFVISLAVLMSKKARDQFTRGRPEACVT